MNNKEAKKLRNKLTKVVTEVIELYKEIGELPVKHTWVIDDCNSVTFDGTRYTFFVDYDELYNDNDIKWVGSEFFKEYMETHLVDTYQYRDNIVEPILKYCKPYCKKAMAARKKLVNTLCEIQDQDEDWVIDKLYMKEFDVEEIVEAAFEDVEIEEEVLYSYDKKTWFEAYYVEDFIESEGLGNGTEFWIKRDGDIEHYIAEVEEVIGYQIGAKKA